MKFPPRELRQRAIKNLVKFRNANRMNLWFARKVGRTKVTERNVGKNISIKRCGDGNVCARLFDPKPEPGGCTVRLKPASKPRIPCPPPPDRILHQILFNLNQPRSRSDTRNIHASGIIPDEPWTNLTRKFTRDLAAIRFKRQRARSPRITDLSGPHSFDRETDDRYIS